MGFTEIISSRSRGASYRKSGEELSEELVELIKKTKKQITRMCEIVEEMEEYGYSERERSSSSSRMREEEDYKMRR